MTELPLDAGSVAAGELATVELEGEPYVVAHHAAGWCLFADACTHAPCALSANGEIVDGTVLVCNCHGAEYDLVTGEVLELPAERPLEVRELLRDGDRLRLV